MNVLNSFFLPKTIDPKLPRKLTDAEKQSWTNFFKNKKKDSTTSSIVPKRKTHDVTTLVTIDSSDRDIYNFPYSNAFTIFPGKLFSRVTEVEVISTAIPNLDTVITEYNNVLRWINEEDADLGFPVYQLTLSTGSYTLANLVARIESQLNDSKIKRRGGNGPPHVFDVSLNKDTGEIEFYSYIAKPLGNLPFTTDVSTTLITVNLVNHGFETGDVIRIIFLQDNIGGIQPGYFDTDFTIDSVTQNTFTIDVGVTPATSSSYGSLGIYVGRKSPFKFLLGSQNSFMNKLGFPEEDSSQSGVVDTIQTNVVTIDHIVLNTWPYQIVCKSPVRLQSGDKFKLFNINWGHPILQSRAQSGFEVIQAINSTTFTTNFGYSKYENLQNIVIYSDKSFVSSNKLYINTTVTSGSVFPCRKIIRLDPGKYVGELAVRTAVPHNLKQNDVVTLTQTDSYPTFDGTFIVTGVYTPIDFTIDYYEKEVDVQATQELNNGSNSAGNVYGKQAFIEGNTSYITYVFKDKSQTDPYIVQRPGRNGWVNSESDVKFYGISDFAGLKSDRLNNVLFKIASVAVNDKGYYQLVTTLPYDFPIEQYTYSASDVRLSSNSFGMASVQQNNLVGSGGKFNRGLFLHGEPYFYLCSPSLTLPPNLHPTMANSDDTHVKNSISTLTSSNVQNVIAILLMADDPGKMVYDGFVTVPKRFYPPLKRIDDIKIELRTPKGELADLQGLDFSFTLRIVEQIEATN